MIQRLKEPVTTDLVSLQRKSWDEEFPMFSYNGLFEEKWGFQKIPNIPRAMENPLNL